MKKITLILSLLLLSACDIPEDRLTTLTGAKSHIERVYACAKISQVDSVHWRVLRDQAKSNNRTDDFSSIIEEQDEFGFSFLKILEHTKQKKIDEAKHFFAKKFTEEELYALVDKYSTVLRAHCEDVLRENT